MNLTSRYTLFASLTIASIALSALLASNATAQERRPNTVVEPTEVALRLPLEVGQGPIFTRGGLRYGFEGSFLPGFAYGAFELNALLSGVYRNPTWDLGLGGRTSIAVVPLFEGVVGLRLGVDAMYLIPDDHARVSGGIIGDLSSLLRIGVWVGHNFGEHGAFGLVTIGTDITTLGDPIGAVVRAGPMEDFHDHP